MIEPLQVFYDASPLGLDYDEIAERGSKLAEPLTLGASRLVVHIQTEEAAVNDFLTLIRTLAEERKAAGFTPKPVTANGHVIKDVYVRRVPKQA
jgi:threonine aldolase